MSEFSPFIVATAGHVDHGKSALVKALTGTDPDRLPEERARGLTIDLGFAHLELPSASNSAAVGTAEAASPSRPPRGLSLGIIDVPGHSDFVKNMVAGVGTIDLALLVLAADDGWMPQTEEHLQILTYLGVPRMVVVLTKADLVPGGTEPLEAMARQQLAGTPFAEARIVPASVRSGSGLDELKTVLRAVLHDARTSPDVGKPRLAVDRVFTVAGAGTVVTGTLVGGSLRRGQEVQVQPGGQTARIRSLQNHHAEVDVAGPGMRTALNLPELQLGGDLQRPGVARGDVIASVGLGRPTDTLDVLLERSARLRGGTAPAARPLRDRTRVRVHFGTAVIPATIFLHGGGELLPGQERLAQLRLENAGFLFGNDRFVLRDWSEQVTLAGGRVLDPHGDRKHWQIKSQLALLQSRAAAPASSEGLETWVSSAVAREGLVSRRGLLEATSFSADEIEAALRRLEARAAVVFVGELAADPAWWRAVVSQAGEAIDRVHQRHPEYPGLPLAELRGQLEPWLPTERAFEALVASLCERDFVRSGSAIRRRSHQPQLPPRLMAAGTWLRQALAEKPFEPPSRKDLTREPAASQALRFLIETGQAVELGPDQVMLAETYLEAVGRVRAFLTERGGATVSELRQLLGCTRRIMVPLCEKLDREGITRREGDLRRLGSDRARAS